jgi:hypothetical protein
MTMDKQVKRESLGWMLTRVFLLCLLLSLPFAPAVSGWSDGKTSSPGQYGGYSEEKYDGWIRASVYIKVRDGARLAADIFRPARGGQVASEPLPVVWAFDRYHRADRSGGRLVTKMDKMPWLAAMIRHGYVIGVVDVRGAGASSGTRDGELTPEEAQDGYDITEWFASQPWSNKRIGMFGRSYLGTIQYLVAGTAPPHLVAIFPEMAMFDLYSFVYPGGVFRRDFVQRWGDMVKNLDINRSVAPVENDPDEALLAAAINQHLANISILDIASTAIFRDSRKKGAIIKPYSDYSPSSYLQKIKQSKVAIYHLSGWYDLWPKDALLWFSNLDNPQKILIGPWSHTQHGRFNLAAERLRWFDYWLKGIDNGIMREAPINYYTLGASEDKAWRSGRQWPPPDQELKSLYFLGGFSGSVKSVNDGILATSEPETEKGKDDYTVNYTATSGKNSRWANGYGVDFKYAHMERNDEMGLTYTSSPMEMDVEVTGHPVVRLWVSSSAGDIDVFAYLEEVEPGQKSIYVTEGSLKASHRAISSPPYAYLNLPYHSGLSGDVAALPQNKPSELVFDLLPVSYVFKRGSRARLTITCADRDNAGVDELAPPPVLTLYRNKSYPSRLILPTIPYAVAVQTVRERASINLSGWLSSKMIVTAILILTGVAIVLLNSWQKKRRQSTGLRGH